MNGRTIEPVESSPSTPSPVDASWTGSYTVRPGDTLETIAGTFGVTVKELVDRNEGLSVAVEEPTSGISVWVPGLPPGVPFQVDGSGGRPAPMGQK